MVNSSDIDVVIIDQPKALKDYSFLLEAIQEKESVIKNVILITDDSLSTSKSFSIPQNEISKLEDHLRSLFKVAVAGSPGHISVPIESFYHFKILPFDLFIKISEDKFVKRIPANEDIEEDIVTSLKNKGVTELYFGKEHNRDFSILLLNNMINKVERSYENDDQRQKARSQVFQTTQEIIQSVGLPPRVIEVCDSVMESISTDVINGKDKLSNYLVQMKDSDLSFSFRFVELTSYVAVQLVECLESKTKDEDIRKIVFAAFFSDISLTDPAHLELRSMASLQDLWGEDQKIILEHALKSSSVVSKYKNAPEGAATLIKEHHGSVSGIGIGSISPDVKPLSKCLISAQEIAYAILKNPGKAPVSVVNDLCQSYQGSPISGYLDFFKQSCLDGL